MDAASSIRSPATHRFLRTLALLHGPAAPFWLRPSAEDEEILFAPTQQYASLVDFVADTLPGSETYAELRFTPESSDSGEYLLFHTEMMFHPRLALRRLTKEFTRGLTKAWSQDVGIAGHPTCEALLARHLEYGPCLDGRLTALHEELDELGLGEPFVAVPDLRPGQDAYARCEAYLLAFSAKPVHRFSRREADLKAFRNSGLRGGRDPGARGVRG